MLERGAFRTTVLSVIWLWLVVFILLPHLFILITSFLENGDTELLQFTFTWDNYQRIFSETYLHILLNSAFIAFTVTFLCLLIGYPCAYILSRSSSSNKNILVMLLVIPFWTSSLVRTYSLIIILKTNGVINSMLLALGLIDQPLELLYTWPAVILGLVYSLLPFMILPLYSVLEKLDNKYIEAAKDLGANKFNLFFRIIIPLSMPGIVAGCMLVCLPSFSIFYIPDLLGGAKDILIGNLIKNQFLTSHDWPFGSAISMMFTLIIIMLLLAYFKSNKTANRGIEF